MGDAPSHDQASEGTTRLSVVFDTSSLFTESGFEVFSTDAKRLINETGSTTNLHVAWLIPRVSFDERLFRLRQKAQGLHQAATEISSLIHRDLGVSPEVLLQAVDAHAQEALTALGVTVADPDWGQIDWARLVADAVNRRPPFSPGASEKGFRDAIVLQTFLQVLDRSAALNQHAFLVTTDRLLQEAARARITTESHAYPPGSLEDLKGLIATLSERLQVELVDRLAPLASAIFFTPGQASSLLLTAGIPTTIQTKYESAFFTVPPGAELRNTYSPSIQPSRFATKEADRYHWANRIEFPTVAYRIAYLTRPASPSSSPMSTGTFPANLFAEDADPSTGGTVYSSSSPMSVPHPSPIPVSTGRTIFEVVWSALYAEGTGFTDARLEDLIFRGTEWS